MPESYWVLSSLTDRALYQDRIIIEDTVYHPPLMSAEGGGLCQHLVIDCARSSALAAIPQFKEEARGMPPVPKYAGSYALTACIELV